MTLFDEITVQYQSKESNKHKVMTQQEQMDTRSVAPVLQSVMQNCFQENRLTCGITESANILESFPDSVFLCILSDSSNVTEHLLSTLIEAFCAENLIPLLKVSDSFTFENITVAGGKSLMTSSTSTVFGTSCYLLQYSEDCPLTQQEEILLNFYQQTCERFPQPVISVPG